MLSAEAITRSGRRLANAVIVLPETDSTNDALRLRAEAGAAEGLVIVAERQTQGRGRLGRTWVSAAGKNLTMSVLLRPRLPAEHCFRVTLLAGVAVAETLASGYGLEPRIKWPNDVLIGERKLCGILAEMKATPLSSGVDYIVLGIGVNLNLRREELPEELQAIATSVAAESGRTISREEFALQLFEALEARYGSLEQGRWPEILDAWRRWAAIEGREVIVETGSGLIQGLVRGVDEDGALRVFDRETRAECRVLAGDVKYVRAAKSPGAEREASGKDVTGH